MLPPPVADPIAPLEQFSITQAPHPDVGVSTGARKDKEIQPLMKAKHSEDDLTIRDMVSKAKDAARVAKEVFEAAETASYEEIEAQLVEEVAKVCRDYYAETWAEALNRAGVLANFKLRRVENIFFPEDI